MPTFPTPGPIDLRVRLGGGNLSVVAGSRTETEVDVRPANPGSTADVECAEETRIDFRDGVLVIEVPDRHGWRLLRSPEVLIDVSLPEASGVRAVSASADVQCRGALADVEVKTASGDVEVESGFGVIVNTASGDVRVDRVEGDVRLVTASGDISLGEAVGTSELSTASGDVSVDHAGGDVRLKTASGDARIAEADGSVTAKTASGDAQILRVQRGSVTLDTASGDLEVGVADGVAAWLDVQSFTGEVRSALEESGPPEEGGGTVQVRARTLSGDISITRAN